MVVMVQASHSRLPNTSGLITMVVVVVVSRSRLPNARGLTTVVVVVQVSRSHLPNVRGLITVTVVVVQASRSHLPNVVIPDPYRRVKSKDVEQSTGISTARTNAFSTPFLGSVTRRAKVSGAANLITGARSSITTTASGDSKGRGAQFC